MYMCKSPFGKHEKRNMTYSYISNTRHRRMCVCSDTYMTFYVHTDIYAHARTYAHTDIRNREGDKGKIMRRQDQRRERDEKDYREKRDDRGRREKERSK